MSRYQSPFESVGITPPRGRLGHSVPTPRPLGPSLIRQEGQPMPMPKVPVIWCDDGHAPVPLPPIPPANPTSFAAKGSPAQFYVRRDHNFGGSASRLDRLRAHQDLPPHMESFVEVEEDESDELLDVVNVTSESPPSKKQHRRMSVTLDRFTGDSLLHFSFNAVGNVFSAPDSQLGGSFVTAFSQGLNASFNVPFLHPNNPSSPSPSGDNSFLFPSAARNPNKAIVTIDAQTSRILVANEMTCELFGYQRDDLPGMKVQKLFTEPYGAKQQALVEQNIDSSGKTVVMSGKVMDALTSYGMEFPVSVWMKQVSPAPQPRVIVVIEPVERSTAQFSMDEKGTIMSCEPWFAIMFAFSDPGEIMGRPVHEIIPSLQLPTGAVRIGELPQGQAVTGRTKDSTAFPITVNFTAVSDGIASAEDLYSPANLSPMHVPEGQSPMYTPEGQSPMHVPEVQSPMHIPEVQQSSTKTEEMYIPEVQQSPMHIHVPEVQQSPVHIPEVQQSPVHIPEVQQSPMHIPEVQQSPVHIPEVQMVQTGDMEFQQTGSNPFLPLDGQAVSGGPILDGQQQKSEFSVGVGGNPFDALESNNKRFTNGRESLVGIEGKSPTNPFAGEGKVPTGEGKVPADEHLHYCIQAKVIVYASLSGMISFLPDGTIHGCNHHFGLMLFGYSQQELLKKDITFLIPDFYNHVSYVDDRSMPLPPLEEGDEGEVFHTVSERSISPDKAFEMARPPGHRDPPKVPLSPRKAAHLHKSPRRAGRAKPAPPISQQDLDVGISFSARPMNPSRYDTDSSALRQAATDRYEVSSSGKDNRLNGLDALVADLSRMQSHTSAVKSESGVDADESWHKSESLPAADGRVSEGSHDRNLQEGYLHTHLNIIAPDELSGRVRDRVTVEGELDAPLHVSSPADDGTSDVVSIEGDRTESVDSDPERAASMDDIGRRSRNSSREEEDYDARPVSAMSAPAAFGEQEELPDAASMEMLLELLKEREAGTGMGMGTPAARREGGRLEPGLGSRKEPRSSTPASHASDLSHKEGDSEVIAAQDDFDGDSVTSLASLPEGTFLGEARHKDGSLLAIIFQLKCVALAGGKSVFCMWISRDLDYERARNADLSASMNRPLLDPYRADQIISPEVGMPSSAPASSQQQLEEMLAMEGEYCKSYDTLRPVGKGAFGFVRMAQRKEDGDMVVVKFLRKSSVLRDCWVDDEQMGHIPLEISLLARIAHPNIVQLLEAYENLHYFQMVMEKHGEGLDLFEFIERNPKLSEQLISYMFRQVVAALAYLHHRNILHRDIKDENIILDHRFHLKLIDFGSAAYMAPGKLFNTFCGTLEYCSPEVLLGNSYSGPELEMWALGVTLYTLIFSENPFFDIEETISGHLQPPFLTSPALMKLIFWLLHPDPTSRATLKDLQKDKWVNQPIDISEYSFEAVLGCAPPSGSIAVPRKTNEKQSENLESEASKLQALEETADKI